MNLKAYRQNLIKNGLHTQISLFSCLHLPAFRLQAAIVSEEPTVFTFSYRKPLVTKFDLTVIKVKVTPCSIFKQTIMGRSPDARCYDRAGVGNTSCEFRCLIYSNSNILSMHTRIQIMSDVIIEKTYRDVA